MMPRYPTQRNNSVWERKCLASKTYCQAIKHSFPAHRLVFPCPCFGIPAPISYISGSCLWESQRLQISCTCLRKQHCNLDRAQRTPLLQLSVTQQDASDWCNEGFETGLCVGPVIGGAGNCTVVGANTVYTGTEKGKAQKP